MPSLPRDVAISMWLKTRRQTAVATATRLPRYARNDNAGTHSANRRCYGDEIATLRSQ